MQGERVLVTGGAGVVGSHVVDRCVEAGAAEVVVFDKLTRGRPENLAWAMDHGPVRLVEGDIREVGDLRKAMADIDLVFHQAAIRITQCAEEPRLALEVMVDGTFNLFEAAASIGVRKVILASSASVYGAAEVFPTPESHHQYANRTFYGAAKTFDEALARSFHEMYGLDYVALRYFNVYGPRMDIHGPHTEVLVRWIDRIAEGEPPLILGDGSQTMDFVHVDDVARANMLAATTGETDAVFNVGTGIETSLDQLAKTLLQVMGSSLEPVYGPERAVNPVPRRVADTTGARGAIGFEAAVGLEEGLTQLVEWWRRERLVDRSAAVAGEQMRFRTQRAEGTNVV